MFIDTILARNDLLQVAERDGAVFKKTQSDWRSICPLHHGQDKTAFSVWVEDGKQKWKCWSGNCGSGDVIDYVVVRDNVNPDRAMEILGGGIPITAEETRKAAEERRRKAEEYAEKKRSEYEAALQALWKARAWELYCANLEANGPARQLWNERGIPDDWQKYWQLGYCPNFGYSHDSTFYHSPTLTIPIYDGGDLPMNIRHRILQPVDPGDKYRPERGGLKALPFAGDPANYDDHDHILVVEGEIKSMVSYIWLDSLKWQVFGIPGKNAFRDLIEHLKGRMVWILFDPDADAQAMEAAHLVGGRVLHIPQKIDDALNAGLLDTASFRRLLSMARKA